LVILCARIFWSDCTTAPNNIDTQHKDSTQLLSTCFTRLEIDKAELSQADTRANIRGKRAERVTKANGGSPPSRSPSQCLGVETEEIISFEHINVNSTNAHDNFVELCNAMGILENMEAGVYSVVETQWDTTCPIFCKFIQEKMKEKDKYVKALFSSNMDESYLTSWKLRGTMIGVSGRWASRVTHTGNDPLRRWNWVDMRGKWGRMTPVISAYRVLQDFPAQAGEITSCKQQARSLMLRGVKKPNPKKRFIEDLSTMITTWRLNKEDCDIILMADMNKFIGEEQALHELCQRTNLINSISLLNLDLHEDLTYLWRSKRINYILISLTLTEVAVKAGHHTFNQYFISDHKVLYIQFKMGDIFDTATMDRRHASYQILRMGRRDIVKDIYPPWRPCTKSMEYGIEQNI